MADFKIRRLISKMPLAVSINKVDLGYGFRIFSILSVMFGQSIKIPPVQIRRLSTFYFLNHIYSFIIAVIQTMFTVIAGFNMFKNVSDFSTAIYFASGFFGVSESVLRSYIFIFKRNEIEKLQILIQTLVNNPNYRSNQPNIIRRLSRAMIVMLIFLFTFYSTAIIANYVSVGLEYQSMMKIAENATASEHTQHLSMEMLEMKTYIESMFGTVPTSLLSCLTVITYLFSFICVGKLILSDVLFYAWYWLIVEEIELLCRSLNDAIHQSNLTSGRDRLAAWIKFHHSVAKILTTVNSITSPCITIAVVCSGLQMCLITFVAVKRVVDVSSCVVLILFGLLSLQQVFVYCVLGQRIRDKVTRLQVSAYRSSWLGSRRATQHAALMICSAATERGMALPGAPFFALSLEFFASILGAAFTYFIVLLQINND